MVLQVGADVGVFARHRNAERLEERAGADAGQLQQLRRGDGAGGEDDLAIGARLLLAAILLVFDADGAGALEQDAGGERVGLDADIAALHRRAQEGAGSGHAPAALGGDLVDADAFLSGTVEIRIEGQAGLLPGLDVAVGERMDGRAHIGDVDRAVGAAPLVSGPPRCPRSP
jgi:ABC-type amino acid transport substrate-binding protein